MFYLRVLLIVDANIQIKNIYKLSFKVNLLFFSPSIKKGKAVCQSQKYPTRDSIKDVFSLSFGKILRSFVNLVFTLFKLFVGKVKEVFVGNFKDLVVFILRKSQLEVLSRY